MGQQLRRERLDAKSFFQSWDRHNRFKVSPKQFRQVLATFGFELTEPGVFTRGVMGGYRAGKPEELIRK